MCQNILKIDPLLDSSEVIGTGIQKKMYIGLKLSRVIQNYSINLKVVLKKWNVLQCLEQQLPGQPQSFRLVYILQN